MEGFEWKKLEGARMSGVKSNICTLEELLEKYRAPGCPVEKQDTCGRERKTGHSSEYVGDVSFRT